MCNFLERLLADVYKTYKCNNGNNALKILDHEQIDLVLSDIMMPGMNGFELCRTIKTNLAYSHIMVVLLTAQSALDSKLEGMDAGADAYIEKPFSSKFLKAQLFNLLHNRQLLMQSFRHSTSSFMGSITGNMLDEQFLEGVRSCIMEHLGESNFTIDELAHQMNMSRVSLDRKIKGCVQMTTNDFIKFIRLKRAAELLREGTYRINEICYITGFTSPSYFTKCFHKQFGMLPKDMIRDNRY